MCGLHKPGAADAMEELAQLAHVALNALVSHQLPGNSKRIAALASPPASCSKTCQQEELLFLKKALCWQSQAQSESFGKLWTNQVLAWRKAAVLWAAQGESPSGSLKCNARLQFSTASCSFPKRLAACIFEYLG